MKATPPAAHLDPVTTSATATRPASEASVDDVAHATGMLTALTRGHSCTEACTGQVTLGDGKVLALTCPYERLDPAVPGDQRIIGSLYASEALAATGRAY